MQVGNAATDQRQQGVYGDIFETAWCFVENGNILDSSSALLLSQLADQSEDMQAYEFYPGSDQEEGCFVACTFWLAEARVLLGRRDQGVQLLERAQDGLRRGVGVFSEMVDGRSGAFLGNLPQGLSHLAHIMALDVMASKQPC